MEALVEFTHGGSTDPFSSKNVPLPGSPPGIPANLARVTFNLSRQLTCQFRTSAFAVGIFGKVARLFRCDRSGCQFTAGIHYSTERGNRQLAEFFLRLDRLADDPEVRGCDLSISDATKEEADCFSHVVKATREGKRAPVRRVTREQKRQVGGEPGPRPIFRMLFDSVGDPTKFPRKKLSVMDGEVSRDYVVGGPSNSSKSLTGRPTREFVAMSIDTSTCCPRSPVVS